MDLADLPTILPSAASPTVEPVAAAAAPPEKAGVNAAGAGTPAGDGVAGILPAKGLTTGPVLTAPDTPAPEIPAPGVTGPPIAAPGGIPATGGIESKERS